MSKVIWRIVLLIVVSFPILGAVQIFSGGEITPYDDYIENMVKPAYDFFSGSFDWIFIALASWFVLGRKDEVKYLFQEKIRKRQYYFEYERWRNTPYIPPLLFYYMMSPPTAFSPYKKDQAHNDFYPLLVRDFQARVSMNAEFNNSEPGERVSRLKVVGGKTFFNILAHASVLLVILLFIGIPDLVYSLTQTGAKYLIPLILHIVGYMTMVCMAIGQTASWNIIDNKLLMYFKQDYLHHEPRIPWVDVLPDTEAGYGIEKMWERDCFRRIQLTYELKGWALPNDHNQIQWINHSIPSNPFPDNLDMSWAPKAREHVLAVKERWLDESESQKLQEIRKTRSQKHGQVVAFERRKKG